jgi:4-amino-4-deoxy-L-arabinose transferase-like glycosyltransferase
MDKEEEIIKKRKKEITTRLKKPSNLLLVAIILLAIILRFNNVIKTEGQALWWDEAEYGSTAKKWALGVGYDLNPQRPPLFQFFWAILLSLGSSELFIKIFLVVIPSIFLVYVTYLLGKEMYDYKVGLIAAFLSATSWTYLFWSSRFQPDFFSMTFQILSILFMWKYWKNENTKHIIASGLFAALGAYFKISALLVPMTFFVFILLRDKFKALSKKDYYIFAATYLVTLVPYFIWAKYELGRWSGFLESGYSNQVVNPTNPFAWNTIKFFFTLTEGPWGLIFFIFLLGVILSLKFFLYFDVMIKDKNKICDPNLFGIIAFIVSAAFYIFYIRGIEDRWIFLWVPFLFFFVGVALNFIFNLTKKYNKFIAILIVLVILLIGGFSQDNHANKLIKDKEESYIPVKLGGSWIKDNSGKEALVFTQSQTQTTYYAERKISSISRFMNSTEFESFINNTNETEKLLMVSIFEYHPPWIHEWISNNQNRLTPLQAYFADEAKTQPVLVIYKIKDN